MSPAKTLPSSASVTAFLKGVSDEGRRRDCAIVLKIMKKVTGEKPRLWGPSLVGFGSYHYRYATGREGDWPLTGFSPRKQDLTIYIMPGFDRYQPLMRALGKHKTGKSCLYLKSLADVDLGTLEKLIARSVADMRKGQP